MLIESNVEIPPKPIGAPMKYPFRDMEIGQSIFIKGDRAAMTAARITASQWGRRHKRRFTTRKQDGGIRIWRIE